MKALAPLCFLALLVSGETPLFAQTAMPAGAPGFYRTPALRGSTLVFAAEGDLFVVPAEGGVARRLTTHPAQEGDPTLSPDGKTLAVVQSGISVSSGDVLPANPLPKSMNCPELTANA